MKEFFECAIANKHIQSKNKFEQTISLQFNLYYLCKKLKVNNGEDEIISMLFGIQ